MNNTNYKLDDQKFSEMPFIWLEKLKNQRISDASPEYIKTITEKTINKNKVKLVCLFLK
jgi:hypothetical protein